ncbi:MAG: hypothetical protein ABSF15_23550 [Candidatus Sulfotelmatobacter sp.]|jgi:hypothetical protein
MKLKKLKQVVKGLAIGMARLESQLQRVTNALSALNGSPQMSGSKAAPAKRRMSASARAKISAAQKARWAKVKAQQKKAA